MKFKGFFPILMLFATIIIAGCGDNGNGPESGSDVLMPLKTGNKWSIQNTSYKSSDKNKVIVNDTTNLEIVRSELVDNEMVYITHINTQEIALVNRLDGFWSLGSWDSAKKKINYSIFMFKYPTKVGDVYPAPLLSNEPMITDAVNIPVVTPAGSFNCIKYHGSVDSTHYYYFATGVGLIKEEQITHIDNSGNTPDTSWTNGVLVSYKLN